MDFLIKKWTQWTIIGIVLSGTCFAADLQNTAKRDISMSVANYRLSAALEKERFNTDEPVYVSVVFENIADQKMPYGGQGRDFDYILQCWNKQGVQVPLTAYGTIIAANRGEGRYMTGVLLPGERLVNRLSVGRLCDLTLSGQYTLKVVRYVFGAREIGGFLESNPVTFEIFEK
jgi:hypothetical protein